MGWAPYADPRLAPLLLQDHAISGRELSDRSRRRTAPDGRIRSPVQGRRHSGCPRSLFGLCELLRGLQDADGSAALPVAQRPALLRAGAQPEPEAGIRPELRN